jgi:hypothetical protein
MFYQKQESVGWVVLVLSSILSGPIIAICMILLYRAVLKLDQANDRYRFGDTVDRTYSSRQVAMQGIFDVWASPLLIVEVPWVALICLASQGRAAPPKYVSFLIHSFFSCKAS